jgi:hypothetical protein
MFRGLETSSTILAPKKAVFQLYIRYVVAWATCLLSDLLTFFGYPEIMLTIVNFRVLECVAFCPYH